MTDKLTEFFTRHHACTEGLSRLAAAYAAAREAQAKWIRDNFVLTDLNIN